MSIECTSDKAIQNFPILERDAGFVARPSPLSRRAGATKASLSASRQYMELLVLIRMPSKSLQSGGCEPPFCS